MRKDNIIWTEIPNKDVLRFGDISHIQRKKGITSIFKFLHKVLMAVTINVIEESPYSHLLECK